MVWGSCSRVTRKMYPPKSKIVFVNKFHIRKLWVCVEKHGCHSDCPKSMLAVTTGLKANELFSRKIQGGNKTTTTMQAHGSTQLVLRQYSPPWQTVRSSPRTLPVHGCTRRGTVWAQLPDPACQECWSVLTHILSDCTVRTPLANCAHKRHE